MQAGVNLSFDLAAKRAVRGQLDIQAKTHYHALRARAEKTGKLMVKLEQPQNLFRAFILALAAALLGLAAANFHRYASTVTDENLFVTSPSQLYVTQNVPAAPAAQEKNEPPGADSLKIGDLLLRLNEEEFDSAAAAQAYLRALPPEAEVEMKILRPLTRRHLLLRVRKSALPDTFLMQIPQSVYVIAVFEGGASDRAGLRQGDLILRINRQGFRDALQADQIMRRGQSDRAVEYDILRANRFLTLHVRLAKLGANIAVPIGFICGLVFMGVALFIGLQRPQLHAARLVSLMLLAFSFPVMVLHQAQFKFDLVGVSVRLVLVTCLLFGVALLYHSTLYFPKERPELIEKRWPIFVPYLLAGFWYVLQIILPFYVGGFNNGVPFFFGLITLSLYGLLMFLLFHKRRSPEYRKLDRVLRWGTLAAGALAFLISRVAIDGASPRTGFIGLPLVLIPLAYLYTIGRHRLLNLTVRVGRSFQYTFASWLWGALLAAAFLFLLLKLAHLSFDFPHLRMTGTYLEVVEAPLPSERRELMVKLVMIGLAFGLLFAFRSMNRAGQLFLARKFYRTKYDYRRAVNEMAEVMATKLNMVDLAKGLAQKLAEHIQLKRVGVLFFRDQKETCCMEGHGFAHDQWQSFCLAVDQQLVQVLQKFRSESRFSVDYLPDHLKTEFERQGFSHLFPIRFKEKLVGALLIGEKLSEAALHAEDLNYLAAVSKQASLAIENAFLYEELAEQERLKHELAIARRIQLASLPQATPHIEGLEIAGISIPAMEVGGDYYDYLNGPYPGERPAPGLPVPDKPEQITIIVGDVSGKGTSAALYMSKVQGILRSLHGFGLSPRELFVRANHLLRQAMERTSFVTSIGAHFQPAARQLRFARAGHLPLFYYSARAAHVEKITPKGLGMGLDDEKLFCAELEEKNLSYEHGDVFLFVTDGVTEAQNGTGLEFGEENVSEILCRHAQSSAEKIRDHLIAAVRSFAQNAGQHDDLTVVVVKAK